MKSEYQWLWWLAVQSQFQHPKSDNIWKVNLISNCQLHICLGVITIAYLSWNHYNCISVLDALQLHICLGGITIAYICLGVITIAENKFTTTLELRTVNVLENCSRTFTEKNVKIYIVKLNVFSMCREINSSENETLDIPTMN